jgi:plastocyanin
MMRRLITALSVATVLAGVAAPAAAEVPDPGFLEPVPAGACTPQNPYEKSGWRLTASGQAGDACKRIHFSYGPITVKPGQNDVLIGPVTIEKPAYDGYITRFKPDLVDATGKPPEVHTVHLHHATWLNAYPQYGSGPFMAAGEEKTIAIFPRGYGMHVGAYDTWLLLFMVHSTVADPTVVWVTYDVDFVREADAEKLGITGVKPVWLDVQRRPIAPGAPDTSGNPVFNVQRGFGHYDRELGQRVCTWPKENCARHDTYGDRTPQQGKPARVKGADWRVVEEAGTIVMLGGHLHPGGIRDEVSLVRNGVEKPIFISDAVYWDRKDPSRAGGPVTSWDFAMTGTGAPLGWKVKIREGDIIRLNAMYDSEDASWYENMGIVVAFVAPRDTHKPAGVDVFKDKVRLDPGYPTTVKQIPGWRKASCTPQLDGPAKTLCLRGGVTHGHLPEISHFGGCHGCQALPKAEGPMMTDISIQGFTYGAADMGVIASNGIPRVKVGEPLRFWNLDTSYDAWHTVTRCKEPCTGHTGLDYPIADGGSGSRKDTMDFDSAEIGYGVFFSPASGQIMGHKSMDEAVRDGAYWEFTPTRTGVYTFYCRIHPAMRGAIKVVK